MRRFLVMLMGLVILGGALWWGISWAMNGGWPGSGPTGEARPEHIDYVRPADGEAAAAPYEFCAHFNYQAGYGLGDEPEKVIRFYLDGWNVTRSVLDLATLEYGYPDPAGEPCYREAEPLKPGWHTARVIYTDLVGERFTYTWRFLALEESD